MYRREFLKTFGLGTVALTFNGCRSSATLTADAARVRKPNIIYILADDLGYGDLGCYGQQKIKTPEIDKMASEGMRFTQHYAGCTVCAPSRCCLMTGYHTGHALVRGNAKVPLRPDDITVAKLLKQAGYTTALVGKWGLGEANSTGIPNKQGFDYFYGYLSQVHAHNYYPEFLWRNEQKVPLRNHVIHPKSGYAKELGGAADQRIDYSHDLFTRQALDFVERHQDDPFFLYLAYTIPHANDEAQRVLHRHGMEVPDYGRYKDKPWPAPEKGYAAMITRMDRDIGKLLRKLQRMGIDDRTIVMFSSDNGPHKEGGADPKFFHSSGPLTGYKRYLTEGGIRVPFIVRWPGVIKAGSTSELVSAFWDILPTCADLAGVKSPAGIDGISILPTLLGKPDRQKKHKFMYWEFHEGGTVQAVRMGDWKAIRYGAKGKLELYNLTNDIAEKNNVADKYPEIVRQIEAYLQTARTPSKYWKLTDKGKRRAR